MQPAFACTLHICKRTYWDLRVVHSCFDLSVMASGLNTADAFEPAESIYASVGRNRRENYAREDTRAGY